MSLPTPISLDEPVSHDIQNGFRVIANDTSSGRPWMWYAPSMEEAQRLAIAIHDQTGQDVTICRYLGRVARPKPKAEFIPATDSVAGHPPRHEA